MKKNIFYILIIIMLVGIFSPFFAVHAETNADHCIASELARNITGTQASLDCASTPNPNATVDPTGTCTYPSATGYAADQSTQAECKINGGTWALDPDGTCTLPDGSINTGWKAKNCAENKGTFSTPYVLLAPLPCQNGDAGCAQDAKGNWVLTSFDPSSASGDKISGYLNLMIKIFIGLCAVLAVVMIVIGGIEYMTTELISSKEAGKERIRGAIFGLLLALGAWTLLNQINPDILNTDLSSLQDVTVSVDLGAESTQPFVAINKASLQSLGITDCTGSGGKGQVAKIAQEFIGKTNYTQTGRNTISGSTINVDCSSFVDQVYSCAGLNSLGKDTASIFSNGATKVTPTTFDPTQLHSGDLVGWKKGDSGSGKVEDNGHVMIYLGNGKVLDTQPNSYGGTAIRNLSDYTKRITYVNWSKP